MAQLSHSMASGSSLSVLGSFESADHRLAKRVESPAKRVESPAMAALFGEDVASEQQKDDSRAFAAVSWILFAIVLSGCLLMLGTVCFIAFL